jgi:hypothetical protein
MKVFILGLRAGYSVRAVSTAGTGISEKGDHSSNRGLLAKNEAESLSAHVL